MTAIISAAVIFVVFAVGDMVSAKKQIKKSPNSP